MVCLNSGKNLEVSVLLDHYSPMLTDKQREVIELYYNEDLSLGEIAEHTGITRQGVRDSIKRGEQILFGLEGSLGLAEKSRRLMKIADELDSGADKLSPADIRRAADRIRDLL